MVDDYETAEQFGKTRALAAPFIGAFILALQQGVVFAWDWGSTSSGALIQTSAWLFFAIVMLLLLLSGGGWFLPRKARTLADDEPSKANRDRAIKIGFVVSIFTCFLVVAVSPFDPLPAQRAGHIIASMGLGTAFVALGIGELYSNG
ncbi:hypothetical protein [Allopontixanthobacter sediminis]|uniref:Uncharacterized protein n=1 Tax=Allopontixanthobacter sediminis TaxID=1689985 RepID=A0A845B7A4_9SPHN|nr:hypothetical protein [Allopontixanthobacter sediminis]MXP45317.1 hypothetical protein [Allopontixanthobacter sediminis]